MVIQHTCVLTSLTPRLGRDEVGERQPHPLGGVGRDLSLPELL